MLTSMTTFFRNKEEKVLKSLDYEKLILESQGFVLDEDVFVYNIELPNSKGHLHTIETGRQNSQILVLVHGYGATGVFYWKIMRQLKEKFHIYSIDLFGQGNSSRPPFNDFSYEKTCNFFCDAINEWIQILDIENFFIAGHSFGGYIVVQLMRLKNPKIKRCFLLSPAGFTIKSKEEILKRLSTAGLNKPIIYLGSFVFYIIEKMKFTPYQLMNLTGKKRSILKYFSSERLKLNKGESFLFGNFYYLIQNEPISSDRALSVFLSYGTYSKQPLVDQILIMKNNKTLPPLTICYGVYDWMDKEHAIEEAASRGLDLDFRILPFCGHQMIFQNPEEISKVICEGAGLDYEPVVVNMGEYLKKMDVLKDIKF